MKIKIFLHSLARIDINDITIIHDYVKKFEEHKTAFQLAIERKDSDMIIFLQENKAEMRYKKI